MPKITKVEPIVLKIPFSAGPLGKGLMPGAWSALEIVLVRVETDDGLTGWGESFGYFCSSAVAAAVRDMVAPVAVGQDASDPAALNRILQQRLHLHGRYGLTIFAVSGLDIALWDLAGKRSGTSLTDLLGGNCRSATRGRVPAYASLMRYGDPVHVETFAAKAAEEGYADVKLHEIRRDTIGAGRKAVGPRIRLTTDINCTWTIEETRAILPYLKEIDLFWLEEPIFPPEDWDALRDLGQHGIAISAGENACTSVEFSRLIPAVTYAQPSVTKVGGITEVIAIADMARRLGRTLMPHSPYFGPGYWATVHLVAARAELGLLEYLYVTPDAWLAGDIPRPSKGFITPPTGPGLGCEPDAAVLSRYRIA